jgi:hypothetical protein
LRRGLGEAVAVHVDQRERRAGLRREERERLPDPGRRPRREDSLATQAEDLCERRRGQVGDVVHCSVSSHVRITIEKGA